MPEQLLARIIRVCSNEGDLVVDPFSGSATTLAVAKKLGRRFLGFDLSKTYVNLGNKRLAAVEAGDRLEGAPEPLMSAPQTWQPRGANGHKSKNGSRTGGRPGKGGKSATLF
jgi:site-specific DNA-methyltransferase (adenine-specific)